MQILYELRYPNRLSTKMLMALLALAFFAVLATTAIAGFLVYRIVKPQRTSTEINMASFPGRPEVLEFVVPGGAGGAEKREGWFFPGLRGAATIVLCHGYESSRGELLTLESALQDHQYNVFIFDFAAHGAKSKMNTLYWWSCSADSSVSNSPRLDSYPWHKTIVAAPRSPGKNHPSRFSAPPAPPGTTNSSTSGRPGKLAMLISVLVRCG